MKKILMIIYAAILIIGFVNVANAFEAAIRWKPYPDYQPVSDLGDIIQIFDDGFGWGNAIDPRINPNSNYIIIQVTGVPADDPAVRQYFKALLDETDPDNVIVIKNRQFKFDGTKVPQNVINQINNNDGFFIVTGTQWNNFITNKEGQL